MMEYVHRCINLDNKLDFSLVKLTDVTDAFPELASAALNTNLPSSSLSNIDLILDGEIMAFLHGKPLHFKTCKSDFEKECYRADHDRSSISVCSI